MIRCCRTTKATHQCPRGSGHRPDRDATTVTYYGVPGVDVPPDNGFQYREPPEDASFMREDEYDRLIDDPVAFLYEVWLPRATGGSGRRESP